jgi:anti-sigma28 factor (negative regulator of flagellin synthesis)
MQNHFSNTHDDYIHRIQTIRIRLDEDSYIVNTRQIADKVIDIEIALSESQHPSCTAIQ